MLTFIFRRLFTHSLQFQNVVEGNRKLDRLVSHVYRKTWTKEQLIKYIKDNVVFESEKYIVSSLPQGIALKKTSVWADCRTPLTCEADLNEIIQELGSVFDTDRLFLTIYPKRDSSGLTIFAKSFQDKSYLKKAIKSSTSDYNYNFLAVVVGCPKQSFVQKFAVEVAWVDDKPYTKILSQWKTSKKIKTVCYRHKVLASSPLASLVQIELSQDVRNCVRHILGTQCLTPVLGDIWNCSKRMSSFLGSSLLVDEATLNTKSVSLNPKLLAQLNLEPGDENLIPIHTHLYSLHVNILKKKKIFLSVPPPESFVWTCKQLGFESIKNYQEV